jgi:hypothetical protein
MPINAAIETDTHIGVSRLGTQQTAPSYRLTDFYTARVMSGKAQSEQMFSGLAPHHIALPRTAAVGQFQTFAT